MTTQYTSILKLALPVQGELSGTWGDVVNDNITSMVEQAIAGRAVINSWSTNSHTLTTANGTTSESRCAMLEFTDTGTQLSGAGTVVCPALSKIYIAKNAAGQSVTLKTASGTGILVPNGRTMFLFCDGTNVIEAVTSTTSLQLGTSTTVTAVLDEDNMASNSATSLATQQSIKAYVDAQVGSFDTLAEVLAQGNTTGSTDIEVTSAQKVQFRDSAIYINSSADGQLDIVADTEIQIAATTIDINGAINASGEIVAPSLDISGNIDVDGTTNLDATNIVGALDVTGTATMDGLTVDGAVSSGDITIAVDDTPTLSFKKASSADVLASINVTTDAGSGGKLVIQTKRNGNTPVDRLTIDDDGNVGIGTSSVGGRLEIKKATASNETLFGIEASGVTTTTLGSITYDQSDDSMRLLNNSQFGGTTLRLGTRGNDSVVIDYSGNVGIGTSSPSSYTGASANTLVVGTNVGNNGITIVGATDGYSSLAFADSAGAGTTADYSGLIQYYHNTDNMSFFTGGSERMRIDSSGNLLVGTTDITPGIGDTNAGISMSASNGIIISRANDAPINISRNSSDGALTYFRGDGTIVGSIGTEGGRLQIGKGASGLYFYDSGPSVLPWNIGSNSTADNSIDLGSSGGRFKDLYLSSGIKASPLVQNTPTSLELGVLNAGTKAYAKIDVVNLNTYDTNLRFFTNTSSSTTQEERMRIDSSGNLLVGKTSTSATTRGSYIDAQGRMFNAQPNGASPITFQTTSNGTTIGSISVTASATSYNTSSDQRLKENIADADDAGSKIDAIQVRKYDWKADGSHQDYGMVAQELQAVAPEAVSGDADSEEMMGVDYSKLVPMLIKEIQSLRNRVAQLEE